MASHGIQVEFHGAAQTVTGSRFLVRAEGRTVLVDCGLFQGYKVLRERNWKRPPFRPGDLDAVLLTHAHVDHSGYLPVVVRDGFRGPIHATTSTRDLCEVLLPDCGHIQEEDARYANRRGFSKHKPAQPLYTAADGERAAERIRCVSNGDQVEIGKVRARFQEAGHILGASSILVQAGGTSVLFSGDLGRSDDMLMNPPEPPGAPDWIVLESTYGNRLHPDVDPVELLGDTIRPALERGGTVLIPAFAVGRSQAVLLALYRLLSSGALPDVPVFLDSPMATRVTGLYERHLAEQRVDAEEGRAACRFARFTAGPEDSKAIDRSEGPQIVVSASGMLTGGRVLHHVKVFGPDARNLIVLPGFQAPGTRGAALAAGASELKIHGAQVPIAAQVEQLPILSAHADRGELLGWLERCERPPRGVILVHGEPESLESLRLAVRDRLGFPVQVADHGEQVRLT